MRTHAWGPTGWPVPVLGQGTWHMEEDAREAAFAAAPADELPIL